MNQVTHFVDQSNVYGSDLTETNELRTFIGGALKVTPRRGHHGLVLLPPDEKAETNCTLSKNVTGIEPPKEVKCFKAGALHYDFSSIYMSTFIISLINLFTGDARVNQTPDLAITQTIFLRQHNLLVAELASINPHWDDERLFQEARRILAAQSQHITYNEWLPIILGIVHYYDK
jgi:peroxidase